jgi:GINS complex subunit 4
MLDFERLLNAYNNEKSTRKLLKYNSIIDEFNLRIQYSISKQASSEISKTIEEIEIERIKYFIKEYILTRMDKLRSNFFLNIELMSENERRFYIKYLDLCKQRNILVDQNQPSNDIEIVGFRAKRELDGVKIDDEIIKISNDDFFVANFYDIENFIEDGSISLL